jgi:uncharacterized protein (TIGR03083 family)
VARASLTPSPADPSAYLPCLEQAAADFAAVLETGELDARVPGCVPWRLTDLAHHLGGIHRWARTAVVDGPTDDRHPDDAPTERAALVDWFREGADALRATLQATDPDTPCWTMAAPQTASFWYRRQAHETAAHAGDAAHSQGATRPYGAAFAVDGIDEIVTMFFPRQVRLGRTPPLAAALAVEAAEGGRWVLAGDGTAPAPGDVPAIVSGPAEAVLLLLWHRITLDDPRLHVAGDRAAADAVLAAALTP